MEGFWQGFEKRATALTGGKGFFGGAGKGNLGSKGEYPEQQGTQEGRGRADGEDTRVDHELLDRERNPRDFGVGKQGPLFMDGATKVVY